MNMKNSFRKIGQFFRKQGFYIALFVCVAGLGVAAVLMLTGNGEPETVEPPIQDVENIQAPRLSDEIAARPSPSVSPTPIASPTDLPSPSPSPSEEAKAPKRPAAKVVLTKPVDGEIIREFSMDKLVYNKTLNQWATHNGVDIKASAGVKVVAALSGTVSQIYMDPVSGGVVVLEHGNGDTTLYAGVDSGSALEVGQKINSGDEIGTLKTAPFEEFTGDHLHFEYTQNGVCKNPADYFQN